MEPLSDSLVECPEGWYDLVEKLIKELERLDPNLHIDQIKSKFGGLRAYISTDVDDEEIQDSFRKLIEVAEAASYAICEVCGETGTFHGELSWMSTLCDMHYQEHLIFVEQRKKEHHDQRKELAKVMKEAMDKFNIPYEAIYQKFTPMIAYGDVVPLPIDNEASWLDEFDAEDQKEFSNELYDAICVAKETGDVSLLKQVVKDWLITAIALEDALRRSVLIGPLDIS